MSKLPPLFLIAIDMPLFVLFSELVIQNPRPYNLVNLFTVRSGCEDCAMVYEELKGAAYSYQQAEDSVQVPTFFAILYYSKKKEDKAVFLQHNFKTIPYLAMSQMQVKRDPNVDFYEARDLWKIKKDDAAGT